MRTMFLIGALIWFVRPNFIPQYNRYVYWSILQLICSLHLVVVKIVPCFVLFLFFFVIFIIFYLQALKEGKRCITVYWLNDTLKERKLRPPYKVWHLPRAFDIDLKQMRDQIVTISNFEGEERLLMKSLILLTGAKYTSYMTDKTTVLICKKYAYLPRLVCFIVCSV